MSDDQAHALRMKILLKYIFLFLILPLNHNSLVATSLAPSTATGLVSKLHIAGFTLGLGLLNKSFLMLPKGVSKKSVKITEVSTIQSNSLTLICKVRMGPE